MGKKNLHLHITLLIITHEFYELYYTEYIINWQISHVKMFYNIFCNKYINGWSPFNITILSFILDFTILLIKSKV